MFDAFEVGILPLLDSLVLLPHLRRFLVTRNETIKRITEGDDWERYVVRVSSSESCSSKITA